MKEFLFLFRAAMRKIECTTITWAMAEHNDEMKEWMEDTYKQGKMTEATTE